MAEEMNVVIESLRSHASKVDGVVDQLNTAVDAAHEMTLADDAYGILCSPFALMLQPLQQNGLTTLQTAVASMQEAADGVRGAAEDYQARDDANSDLIGGIG